jgi:hypothetical protein
MLTAIPQPQPPGRLPASVAEAVAEIRAKAGMDADPTNPLTTPIVDLFAPTVASAKAGTRGVDLMAFDAAKATEPTTLADDIARQYPTIESIIRSVPLKPEQAAMVRNILGSALAAPPGQMTGVQVMALKRSMLNAKFDHGIAGAIAMRAEALLRAKRGEGVLLQPRAATMRRVRGQEMRRSMRTDNDEGPMLDFDAAADVLEKARKQIETGPRGGKIVGYRTAGGKRTPIYEKPGAGGASPSKGEADKDAPKAAGGEDAAEALRDHADEMETQGAVASEVRKVAKKVEAAAKRKAKAAAAKAAADKADDADEGDEAGAEEADTEAEVEANQAQLAQTQRDDVEGAAGTGEAEPAAQADKAPKPAPAAAAGGDAEADADNGPPGQAGVPSPRQRKTPTIDRDPVSPLGPEPDWDKIGNASNLTPEEALNRKETQEARKQYEAMFERLAAIEHQITSELVPMFNAIKNDIRRAVETNGRSIPRPKNVPKPMTPVEFLWEKVTAFIEFVGKMIASGARYAADKIKSIGGPKPPKGGDTEKSMRPVLEYRDALRKGGDGVSYLPTRILDGLFDVLRDAMADDRMGDVAAAFASAYPYGADDGDGDEDDMRADERPPMLPSERRSRALASSVAEFLSGLDDDVEIPEELAMMIGFDDLEKGAGHKYIRRVPKTGGGYRYYYKVAGVTRDVGADLVQGAAFKLAADGKEGHFQVTGRDGDKVTLRHDESGKEMTVDAKALGAMLQREHAEVVGAKREAIKREIAQAEKTGTPKQRERLKAEAERLGVDAEAEAEKPAKRATKEPAGSKKPSVSALASRVAPEVGESPTSRKDLPRLNAIARAMSFASDDDSRPSVYGVNIGVDNDEKASAIATDGRRIAMIPTEGYQYDSSDRTVLDSAGNPTGGRFPDVGMAIRGARIPKGVNVDGKHFASVVSAAAKAMGKRRYADGVMIRNEGGRVGMIIPGGVGIPDVPEGGLYVDLGVNSSNVPDFESIVNVGYLSDAMKGSTGPVSIASSGDTGLIGIRRDDGERHYIAPVRPIASQKDRWLAKPVAKSARTIEDIVQYAAEVAGDDAGLLKSEGFTPPERVASAAARGLRLREKVKGGTAIGVARARDLSNRKAVSLDTIRRMVSYFARHGAQRPEARGTDAEPTPWLVAWNLWGGDAGRAWAESIWERERGDTKKSARTLGESIIDFLADAGLSRDGSDAPSVVAPPAPADEAGKATSHLAKSIGEFLGPLAGDSGVLMPPGEYTVGTTAYGRRALPGGLLVDVEVPAGGVRRGVGADGREWAVTMPADYGEFVGTMGTDGDPIDVFVGPDLGAPYAYIVGIQDPATGLHDEDKVMFGFRSRDDAMACYRAAYGRGDLLMSVQRMSVAELQMWVERHGQSARRIAEGRPMRKGVSSVAVAAALASFGAVERVSTPLDTVLTSVQWCRAPDRLRGREGGEPVALNAIRRPALRSAPSAKPHVEPVLVIKSAPPPASKPAPAGARLAGLLAKGRR